jgi:hypothetical protein
MILAINRLQNTCGPNRTERAKQPVEFGTAVANCPNDPLTARTGKETVMRILLTLVAIAMFAVGLTGCRAEGEIGDAQTSVGVGR